MIENVQLPHLTLHDVRDQKVRLVSMPLRWCDGSSVMADDLIEGHRYTVDDDFVIRRVRVAAGKE